MQRPIQVLTMHAVHIDHRRTPCGEKARLLSVYDHATGAFSGTVHVLKELIGTVGKAEYEYLRSHSEQARLECDKARYELEMHIQEHGC